MFLNKISKLFFWILLSEFIGILGSVFTFTQITTWYFTLDKPFFSPPNWVFGPVWTMLYALMGISAFLIYEAKINRQKKNYLLGLFMLQLFLNFLWSLIFFGMHLLYPAFIEILILWGVILMLIIRFRKYSKLASNLLIPYLLWVTFASFLNLSVAILN